MSSISFNSECFTESNFDSKQPLHLYLVGLTTLPKNTLCKGIQIHFSKDNKISLNNLQFYKNSNFFIFYSQMFI